MPESENTNLFVDGTLVCDIFEEVIIESSYVCDAVEEIKASLGLAVESSLKVLAALETDADSDSEELNSIREFLSLITRYKCVYEDKVLPKLPEVIKMASDAFDSDESESIFAERLHASEFQEVMGQMEVYKSRSLSQFDQEEEQ